MDNKTKVNRLHDQMPKFMRTKSNINWSALLEAIGTEDEYLHNLLEEVRKQFFMKTASRPYIDRLGANVKVDRPRFIGMDDPTFRKYVPILAYQPKQVKLIIDTLLDLFFFKESTTSFIVTEQASPYNLEDGWELEYDVDGDKTERIEFNTEDFTNIAAATAEEVAAAINRQATSSFAVVFSSSVTQEDTVRLFTNTIGSKGSVEMAGGRGNIALQFNGFISDAGTGNDTQWDITKVGYTTTMEHVGGNSPGLDQLETGDIIINNLTDNVGSFIIDQVIVSENKIVFENTFSTPGSYTQSSDRDVKFIRPFKSVIYKEDRRAITWETQPGEITVEMPTTPPVVRRSLQGSAHINGLVGVMTNRDSDTSLTLEDASSWPTSGTFVLEQAKTIQTRYLNVYEDVTVSKNTNSRIQGFATRYTYTGKSSNTLTGISPNLPELSSLNQFNISSADRVSKILTVTTASAHGYSVGEYAIIYGTSVTDTWNSGTTYAAGDLVNYDDLIYRSLQAGNLNHQPDTSPTWWSEAVQMDGSWEIFEIVNTTEFKCYARGEDLSTGSTGTVRVERAGLAASGSKLYLKDSQAAEDTEIIGPYIWDEEALFVLSSYTGLTAEDISAGQIKKILELGINTIPEAGGEVIFDFGTEQEEGPIRYLYKPSSNSIALDPAYVFQYDHGSGSSITMINQRGAHAMSGDGSEYAFYVTDTAAAREILQDIIREVKSVGIFVEFLVRYPEQLYATLDVYRSGVDPG